MRVERREGPKPWVVVGRNGRVISRHRTPGAAEGAKRYYLDLRRRPNYYYAPHEREERVVVVEDRRPRRRRRKNPWAQEVND